MQDLRRFTRAEVQASAIVDLPVVLRQAMRMVSTEIRGQADIVLRFGTTPFIAADEGALCQVFTSLFVNAAQAMSDPSSAENQIVVTTFTDDAGRAVVEVVDNGAGISAEVLPRVFDPFFTTKFVGQGTGLGLAISHHVVTSLGGELTVDSVIRQGTRFRIALPPATRSVAPSLHPPSLVPVPKPKVLVVDDDVPVARALSRILRGDCDVTVVDSGPKALSELAGRSDFDLVFCDLDMPQMTGMDVFEAVRGSSPDVAARFIFTTGGALSPRATTFLDRTANPVVRKPFGIDEIRALVKDHTKPSIVPADGAKTHRPR